MLCISPGGLQEAGAGWAFWRTALISPSCRDPAPGQLLGEAGSGLGGPVAPALAKEKPGQGLGRGGDPLGCKTSPDLVSWAGLTLLQLPLHQGATRERAGNLPPVIEFPPLAGVRPASAMRLCLDSSVPAPG